MRPLTPDDLKKFLKLVGSKLNGDWVLMGGCVLPAIGVVHRVTVDIDIVPVGDVGNSENLRLMELAEKMGIPIEAINPAGSFFLRRIPHFKKKLILLHKGKKASLFRPNLELYIQLKIDRLSDSDVSDCEKYIAFSVKKGDPFDSKRIRAIIDGASRQTKDRRRTIQLNKLRRYFMD